jgi:hypothetical protein
VKTTIYVPEDLHAQVRRLGLNWSELARDAARVALAREQARLEARELQYLQSYIDMPETDEEGAGADWAARQTHGD